MMKITNVILLAAPILCLFGADSADAKGWRTSSSRHRHYYSQQNPEEKLAAEKAEKEWQATLKKTDPRVLDMIQTLNLRLSEAHSQSSEYHHNFLQARDESDQKYSFFFLMSSILFAAILTFAATLVATEVAKPKH